jgi:hypothetical protein
MLCFACCFFTIGVHNYFMKSNTCSPFNGLQGTNYHSYALCSRLHKKSPAKCEAIYFTNPLLLRFCFFLTHQISLDESIKFAIHNRTNITHFIIGTMIFDHLVWMENIAADLAAPLDLFLL